MKKITWLLLLGCIIPKLVWSQYAIKLDSSNTLKIHQSYLLNIPVKPYMKKLLILDPQGLIPVSAFMKCNDNWNFHTPDTTIIVRPVNKIKSPVIKQYLIKRSLYGCELDSLSNLNFDLPNSTLLYPEAEQSSGDSALVYYTEDNASSACCDLHSKPDSSTLNNYISNFEKLFHLKIGKIFNYTYGDEGEYTAYLTLSGLTPQQKIAFIDGRIQSLYPNNVIPILYRPQWVLLSNIIKQEKLLRGLDSNDPNMVYTLVEKQPYYPKGQMAFKKYIYGKMKLSGKPTARIVISFTVNKNGTLTDARIERTPDDKLNPRLLDIISHSPKWKPGINDNKIVRSRLTMVIYD